MPPKRKKTSVPAKKPSLRKRDEPDPSLILDSKRVRKLSSRAQSSSPGSTVEGNVAGSAGKQRLVKEMAKTDSRNQKKRLSRIEEEPTIIDDSDVIETFEPGNNSPDPEHIPLPDTDSSMHDSDFDLEATEVPELKKPKNDTKAQAGKKEKNSNYIQAKDIQSA
jgi:hypothetical protein